MILSLHFPYTLVVVVVVVISLVGILSRRSLAQGGGCFVTLLYPGLYTVSIPTEIVTPFPAFRPTMYCIACTQTIPGPYKPYDAAP